MERPHNPGIPRFVNRSGTNADVLVIIIFRPEFYAPWVGRPHVTLISLTACRRAARSSDNGRDWWKALPKEIADQIIDRTDGVPLFIEELTKSVVESGILTKRVTTIPWRDR